MRIVMIFYRINARCGRDFYTLTRLLRPISDKKRFI